MQIWPGRPRNLALLKEFGGQTTDWSAASRPSGAPHWQLLVWILVFRLGKVSPRPLCSVMPEHVRDRCLRNEAATSGTPDTGSMGEPKNNVNGNGRNRELTDSAHLPPSPLSE